MGSPTAWDLGNPWPYRLLVHLGILHSPALCFLGVCTRPRYHRKAR